MRESIPTNPHFIIGEGWPGFPARSYARIDQVEPPDISNAQEITFSFDAVDAAWKGFQPGNLLSLDPEDFDRTRLKLFWHARFGQRQPDLDGNVDPYDGVPLYQIELSLPRFHPWVESLLRFQSKWLELNLASLGKIEVDVFGGLFQEPVGAYISEPPQPAPNPAALDAVFDMDLWPDGMMEGMEYVERRCRVEQLFVFDVGQGSASALVCGCGVPCCYFDVGCGVYRNARTTPASISFCVCHNPPVILSHWDSDHWAGAIKDPALQGLSWIVPRQKIGPKHTAFGNQILKAGGSILIVPIASRPIRWTAPTQTLELRRGLGAATDRNGSGLILIAEDSSQRGWLLTGDAGYDLIPGTLPSDLAAVVVPHHGADMGAASIPPACSTHSYSRLLYSFGPGNVHGRSRVCHPTQAAMDAHVAASWTHGAWQPASPGMNLAGLPVLATASHVSTHLGGAAAGWTAAPSLPAHLCGCSRTMPIAQA